MRRFYLLIAVLLFATAPVPAQEILSGNSAAVTSNVATPKSTPPVSLGADGLIFSTEDKAYRLQVHGYVQGDDRMFSDNIKGEALDTFLFRRIRPIFEGTLFNAVDFRFMPDFGQNNPQIQEAYLEVKTLPFAKLRVGKFKEPVGLEVLKSDRELTFAERSLASDLVPLRYMGAQVGGSFLSNSFSYEVGYFNGANDGSNGSFKWIAANEAAARVFLQPFASTQAIALRQLGFGVAGSAGDQHGAIAGLKTVGQSTFFKYSSTATANGQHNRVAPQAYYYGGPLGVLTEYVISSQDVLNKKVNRRIRNEAWQAEASVVLTGEKNGYGGIRPRYSFEPNRGVRHLGALELALRSSQLRIDKDAFPLVASPKTAAQKAQEWGIGLNWYLNRFAKLATDYEHTTFGMAAGNVAPFHSENVLMSRIQLAF
ncbi:MAG: porin [Acidobacteria bacterium]|nr:porin [Acidobacteriota bacterium]